MKFGYTIIYVPDVKASLTFFEEAFGFSRRFLHESGDYGELQTGETTLAFAAHSLGSSNLPDGYVKGNSSQEPLGVELAFVTDKVARDHGKAISCGASEIKPPESKPWGQDVSYVRCPDGTLIELCSPVGQ